MEEYILYTKKSTRLILKKSLSNTRKSHINGHKKSELDKIKDT